MKVYVAQFVPYVWMVRWHLYRAKAVLEPLIAKRRKQEAAGTLMRDEKFDNLLHFMDDAATGVDARPAKLAERTLVLTSGFITYHLDGSLPGTISDVRIPRVHSRAEGRSSQGCRRGRGLAQDHADKIAQAR